MDDVLGKTKDRMQKSLDSFCHELSKMRTGRASLSVLDDVRVDCYGSLMPLNQVATLSLPDPRTIVIQPWDASVIPGIEKALQKADLGFNPVVDGKIMRLPVPSLTEERRKELVKGIHRHAEEAKVSVRNIRRDSNESIKKLQKDSEITEDDEKKGLEQVQKITDEYVHKIDETVGHKEKDVMEV